MSWTTTLLVTSYLVLVTSYLVLVAHELDDDAYVLVKVLGGDDAHDVGSVGGVGILTARVDHDETRVG